MSPTITFRIPVQAFEIVREIAARRRLRPRVLLEQWLGDAIRYEAARTIKLDSPALTFEDASFQLPEGIALSTA